MGGEGFDTADDPFHFLFGLGDEASGLAWKFHPLGSGVFFDFVTDAV